MYIYMHTILVYLRDFVTYMRQVAIHTMDCVDAATTNVLSTDILPVEDLRNILRHIKSKLPSMMHLTISSVSTLHFCQYLNIPAKIAYGQFLLLIDVSYKTEDNSFKYMKFSVYQFHAVTCQPSIRLIINI